MPDLGLNDFFRQTEFWNTVHQHAAGNMKSFEDRHFISHFRQIAGSRQPGRTGSYDGHLMPVGFRFFKRDIVLCAMRVGHEPLETADRDRFGLDAADAVFFALAFLRTNTAAYSWQRGREADDPVGFLEIAFFYLFDKIGNVDIDRTSLDTWLMLAVKTALRFLYSHLRRIAHRHFFKIRDPCFRILGRHWRLFWRHVRHYCSSFRNKRHASSRSCCSKSP